MPAILIYLITANFLSFALTGMDKYFAVKKMRRLPEKAMIRFSLIAAGPGVLAAFYTFRHKTKHKKLLISVWLITLTEAAILISVLLLKA